MKKLLTVCLSLLVIIPLFIAMVGCGGKGGGGGSATEVLNKSQKTMKDIKSYRVETTGKTSSEGVDQDVKMEMKVDNSNPENPNAAIAVSTMGTDMEIYLYDKYTYVNVPGQGWVKTPIADMSQYEQMTLEGITKMSEGATNLKMVSENDKSYELSFSISEKYFKDLVNKSSSTTDLLGEEFSKILDEMLKSMEMSSVLEIDKQTMYITDAKVKMTIKDMPMVGDISTDMNMAFSDFNKKMTVELPAEAQTAKEVSPSELGTIPGLSTSPIGI